MNIKVPLDQEEGIFFLVRYGEMALKSNRVKKRFLRKLCSNLEERFLEAEVDCYLEMNRGRVYAYPSKFGKGADILSSTFGIVSFSPVISIRTSDLDEICGEGVEYSQWLIKKEECFAVRTRRVGTHSYSSQDVNVKLGQEILQNNAKKNISVNLNFPDKVLYIEIRDNITYFYHQKINGPGGLPYGVSGCSLCLVGNRPSLLAAYLMMKRGNRLIINYSPQIYKEPIDLDEIVAFFKKYLPSPNVQQIPDVDERNMFPTMGAICKEKKCDGIVLGLELGPVIENIEKEHAFQIEYPVFYPIIGFSNDEIEKRLSECFRTSSMEIDEGKSK